MYIFTRRDIRQIKQSTDILVGAWIYTPSQDNADVKTEKQIQNIRIKRCIIRTRECLVVGGRRKCFPTLPKFLSTHMTLHLWIHAPRVYPPQCVQSCSSTPPNISQSLCHTQSHSGQLSGWRDIYIYNIIMSSDHLYDKTGLYRLKWTHRKRLQSLTDNVTGLQRQLL